MLLNINIHFKCTIDSWLNYFNSPIYYNKKKFYNIILTIIEQLEKPVYTCRESLLIFLPQDKLQRKRGHEVAHVQIIR